MRENYKKNLIFVPITLIICLMIFSILVEKSGYKEFVNDVEGADKIYLFNKDKQLSLSEDQIKVFKNEIKNNIFNWDGHPFDEYLTRVIIKSKEGDLKFYAISPDYHFPGQYWILTDSGQRVQKIKSLNLMFLFNRNGFFDHTKIVD